MPSAMQEKKSKQVFYKVKVSPGTMASAYLPVETVLKVDDSELLLEESEKHKPPTMVSFNCVSIGTQCDWKFDQSANKTCSLLPESERAETELTAMAPDSLIMPDKNACDSSLILRSWSRHCDSNLLSDQKIFMPATFSQQFVSNLQSGDSKSLLQLDYKTRNKYKTKQRRQDPFYRSQERVRQRTVMRIKRQDPGFREAEREKGRYRMRLKRLDPEFRSQERERQRERMKAKRSDPEFREREREQQKTRLHVKRLDPAFKEKERAQDRLRMRLKRQNNSLFANLHADTFKVDLESENASVSSDKMLKDMCQSNDSHEEYQNQTVFPENFSAKLLSLKPRESVIETFHFKKQQILNFNFYNTGKEQWTQEMCSPTTPQTSDISESNTLQAEVSSDVMKKLPLLFKKEDLKDESSSESFEDIKPNELCLAELQKNANSSHITVSTNKYSSTNTEN